MPHAMDKLLFVVIVGCPCSVSIERKLAGLGANKPHDGFARIPDLTRSDHDHEMPRPAAATHLTTDVGAAAGALLVTPEHDRSTPAVLKNADHWGRRSHGKIVWGGKSGLITDTSSGALVADLMQQNPRLMTGVPI